MMCNIARSLAANNAPTIFTASFPNYDATESGNRSATFPELIGKKYILIRGNRNYERTIMSADYLDGKVYGAATCSFDPTTGKIAFFNSNGGYTVFYGNYTIYAW